MKKISCRRDVFPTYGISLTKSEYVSDGWDMEIKLKEVINRELKSRNESVHAAAESTGIPSSTLHAWSVGQLPSAKNLHHIKKLADHLGISLMTLLFNKKDDTTEASILFSSTFVDQDKRYRLVIEKLPK
jgi:hypothetical protein